MFVLWLRPDQTVLSPAQDHRLLHGDLGVYSDLAGDGVVLAVTPRHCEVVVLVLPQPSERLAGRAGLPLSTAATVRRWDCCLSLSSSNISSE